MSSACRQVDAVGVVEIELDLAQCAFGPALFAAADALPSCGLDDHIVLTRQVARVGRFLGPQLLGGDVGGTFQGGLKTML